MKNDTHNHFASQFVFERERISRGLVLSAANPEMIPIAFLPSSLF